MDFFRNPEIRKSFAFWLMTSIILTGTAAVVNSNYLIPVIICCIIFVVIHFISTYRRYLHIAGLSHEIDKILHNSSKFDLKRFSEGELAILHSEIYKMTVRLREQADILKKDKTYLADSIADISHQIRTPLTSINLIASFLSEEDLDSQRRMNLTNDLKLLLSRIDWLISTLLKISKLDTGTVNFLKNKTDVSELIRRATKPLAIPMDLRNQDLIVNMKGGEFFEGDLSWTCEAIENVLKNCMEHTPEGGTISIDVNDTPIYVMITISDTGPGISKEDLPNLFKRFYKGKDSPEGNAGIGLALARMIIAGQNGTIEASNGTPGGAVFTIRFYKDTV